MKTYEIELCYASLEAEDGIFHAFEAVDAEEKVDYDAVADNLAGMLRTTTNDARFTMDSMRIKLPETTVSRILAEASGEKRESSNKTLNSALEEVWGKIHKYCKEQYSGISPRDVQVRWKQDMYFWSEFGVTPNGDIYIVHGNHDQDSRADDADWYFHPDHKTSPMVRSQRCHRMEEAVRNWPKIKEMLAKRFDEERRIFDFKG